MVISRHFLQEVGFLYSAHSFHYALNELKKCEKYLIVSTAYCQRVLQLSYTDLIYLYQRDEYVVNIWHLYNFNTEKKNFFVRMMM